jgi:outer membrane protein OmpA-like peptidoglycan-associated protein
MRQFLMAMGCCAALSACVTLPEPAAPETVAGQIPAGSAAEPADAARVSKTGNPPEAIVVEEKTLKSAVDRENSVFFPSGSVAVDAAGRKKLIEHAARLKADSSLSVTLIGHTDDLGSPSYNLAIAEQRVNAVFSILRSQGVPVSQLRRYGMGSEAMHRACLSPECRALMRRVELDYGR